MSPTHSFTATQSAIAVSACTSSFVRPETPRERRCRSFVTSSANPSAAMASVVPSTQRLAARYSDRIRNGTQMARRIASPPMVGVPAFPAWPAGPSSRMCWPNS